MSDWIMRWALRRFLRRYEGWFGHRTVTLDELRRVAR